MITRPDSITPGKFTNRWLRQVTLDFRSGSGTYTTRILASDGQDLLDTQSRGVNYRDVASRIATDPVFANFVSGLKAEIVRLSKNTEDPEIISIIGPEPSRPVALTVRYAGSKVFQIRDCRAQAAIDPAFSAFLDKLEATVSAQAGITLDS